MHPRTIRLLDYWVGVPLCFLLTVCRALVPARQSPTRSIVFLKFIEQGATVLARDAIGRAAATVGRDNVYFCVFEGNRAILDVLDLVPQTNIIIIRDRELLVCLIDFAKALWIIRSRGIDTSIDMEFFSRASAIFAFLSGTSNRVGLHRFTSELPYRGDLFTHRVQYSPYQHVSIQYALLVEAVAHDPADTPMLKVPLLPVPQAAPSFEPTAQESRDILDLLASAGGEPLASGTRPIIILNPNASDLLPLRKWDGARFVELGRRIVAHIPGALVVITGAASERKAAEELCAAIGSDCAVSVAGRTTMRELLALYTLADVLVTNDSGPGHFSSLTKVQTIVLFGPETPQLFGPLSPTSTVIWKNLACSPCVSVFNHRLSPCRDNVCMKTITVDDVYAAVVSGLERRAS